MMVVVLLGGCGSRGHGSEGRKTRGDVAEIHLNHFHLGSLLCCQAECQLRKNEKSQENAGSGSAGKTCRNERATRGTTDEDSDFIISRISAL